MSNENSGPNFLFPSKANAREKRLQDDLAALQVLNSHLFVALEKLSLNALTEEDRMEAKKSLKIYKKLQSINSK